MWTVVFSVLYLGTIIGPASGKLNGVVFSRNRGGPYIKNWVQPDETTSDHRDAARAAMAACAAGYQALTDSQRATWDAHSTANPRRNRIGQVHPIGAYQEYTRANFIPQYAVIWLGASFTLRDAPPIHEPLPNAPPTFAIVSVGGTPTLQVTIPAGHGYSTNTQAGLALFISPSVRPNLTYLAYPHAFQQVIQAPGAAGTVNSSVPSGLISGLQTFIQGRYLGRYGALGELMKFRVPIP